MDEKKIQTSMKIESNENNCSSRRFIRKVFTCKYNYFLVRKMTVDETILERKLKRQKLNKKNETYFRLGRN